jgi:hypothetical protein
MPNRDRAERRFHWLDLAAGLAVIAVVGYMVGKVTLDIIYGIKANHLRLAIDAVIARNTFQTGLILMLLAVIHLGIGIKRFRRTGDRTGLVWRWVVAVAAIALAIAVWVVE